MVGPIRRKTADSTDRIAPQAPGRLPWHYAPRTPLQLVRESAEIAPPDGLQTGWIGLAPPPSASRYALVEVLAEDGDLRRAAAGLFAALHRLDAAGLDLIQAQLVPETGLGLAINDRLRRAAAAIARTSQ